MNRLMRMIRTLALLTASAAAAAQDTIEFACPTTIDNLEVDLGDLSHLQVDLGDLNSDGLPDEVALDPSAPFVHFHLGKGNGTYGAWTTLTGPICNDVAVGDVTGDGLDDIITVEAPGAALIVHPSLGSATFGPSIATPTDLGQPSLERQLADMDGDGRLDYVAIGAFLLPMFEYRLTVAKSWGPANFEISAQVKLGSDGGTALAIADYDTDGMLDVAVKAAMQQAIDVYAGAGEGTLSPEPSKSILPSDPQSWLSTIGAADFDSDGITDLATASLLTTFDTGLVGVMRGGGDGTFTTTQLLSIGSSGRLATGDLDGNGWPDVVVKQAMLLEEPPTIVTLLNDGAGSLVPKWARAGYVYSMWLTPGPAIKQLRLLDLDGDDIIDVHFGNFVAKGDGNGSLIVRRTVAIEGKPVEVATADLNLDGNTDLVATLAVAQSAVAVALGTDDGGYQPVAYPTFGSLLANELACGDIDGDGNVDLVIDPGFFFSSSVWINDGTGLAFPSSMEAFQTGTTDLVVADLNADGHLDLTASHATLPSILVRLNTGSGSLLPVQAVPLGDWSVDLLTSDLDADGHLDLVAGLGSQPAVAFALGSGSKGFASAQIVDIGVKPTAVAVADFNGDGLSDLAACAESPATVVIVRATSAAHYGAAEPITLDFTPADLQAADINGDQRADLITLRHDGDLIMEGLVALLTNSGDGTFAPPQHYLAGGGPVGLVVDDVDFDGLLDLVLGSTAEKVISIVPNVQTEFPSLGFQYAASFGFPRLIGSGSTAPKQLATLAVEGVPSHAVGFVFLGLDFAPQPFHGGTLVPSSDTVAPMHPDIPLYGRWPPLPVGTKIFAQAWFAVDGEFAGTNAIYGATK